VKKNKAQLKKASSVKRNNLIRLFLVCAVGIGFFGTLISQQITLADIRRETDECSALISEREEEFERLKKKAKYNSTDEYYEEKARDEGYVRDDETVFIVGN